MGSSIDAIADDFAFLDDWEDRYRYIIDLGKPLGDFPAAKRIDRFKVPGCVSQVWLVTDQEEGSDPILRFKGDSDAHIVRGLVAIILALYSGRHASEILAIDAEAVLRKLGLDEHLTPQRANGLRSMVKRIRADAAAAGAQSA